MTTENQKISELQLDLIDLDKKFTRDQLDVWTYFKDLSAELDKVKKELKDLKK